MLIMIMIPFSCSSNPTKIKNQTQNNRTFDEKIAEAIELAKLENVIGRLEKFAWFCKVVRL